MTEPSKTIPTGQVVRLPPKAFREDWIDCA